MAWVLAVVALAFASTASAQSGADLSITLTNNQTSLTRGHYVLYEFTARNDGPLVAQGAQITYTIPSGLEFEGFSGASGWACATPQGPGDTVLSCTRSTDMAAVTSTTSYITLKVKPDATGSIANTIAITATTLDPNPANNTATDTDPVIIPSTVPTLTEWAMILFAALLAGTAALTLHRRRHA